MSVLPATQAFPLHARALERHAEWAREFARVGETDELIDELFDIRALAEEVRDDADGPLPAFR